MSKPLIWVAGSPAFQERLLSLRDRLPDREFAIASIAAGDPDLFFVEVGYRLDIGLKDCITDAHSTGKVVSFGRHREHPDWIDNIGLELESPLPDDGWEHMCLAHINRMAPLDDKGRSRGLRFVISTFQHQLEKWFTDAELNSDKVDPDARAFVKSAKDCLRRVTIDTGGLLPPPPPYCEFHAQLKTAVTMIWCRHRYLTAPDNLNHHEAPKGWHLLDGEQLRVKIHPLLLKCALITMIGHTWMDNFQWSNYLSSLSLSRDPNIKIATFKIERHFGDDAPNELFWTELSVILNSPNNYIRVENNETLFHFEYGESGP